MTNLEWAEILKDLIKKGIQAKKDSIGCCETQHDYLPYHEDEFE